MNLQETFAALASFAHLRRPAQVESAWFGRCHGCFVDRDAGIYISDWNYIGRIAKLQRI